MFSSLEQLAEYGYKRLLFQPVLNPTGSGGSDTVPDPANCTVGVSAGTLIAGAASVTITVTAKNSLNAAITVGGAAVLISYAGGTSTGVISIVTDVQNGTYTATFIGLDAGSATTISATINGATISTTMPTITVSYATPDIMDNEGLESNYGTLTDDTVGGTPNGVDRSTTRAYAGSYSLHRSVPVTNGVDDVGGEAYRIFSTVNHGEYDRLWLRFYVYLDNAFDGIQKFFQFFDSSHFTDQFNGFGFQGGRLQFDFPDNSNLGTHNRVVTQANLANGSWHKVEVDYWRNNCITADNPNGWPNARVWYDDATVTFSASGDVYMLNGRVYSGRRTTSEKMGVVQLIGLTNGGPANTIASHVYVDKISISTLGRVG